jgi:hypothetical protein
LVQIPATKPNSWAKGGQKITLDELR